MSGIAWQPDPDSGARMRALCARLGVSDSRAAHAMSVADPGGFWALTFEDLGVVGDRGARTWIPGGVADARFLPDAWISVVDTLLDGPDEDVVLVARGEHAHRRTFTRGEVRCDVAQAAAALRAAGVGVGDRVAAWTPNVPETAVLALAALSIGAVVCTTPTDMAPEAVIDRLSQVDPVFMLVSDHHDYAGRAFDDEQPAREIVAGLPSVSTVVHLDRWKDWIEPHHRAPWEPMLVPMDQPGFILFTSGTTGRPKCIMHSAAGVLLKVLSEQVYHLDIREGDRVTFYSTTGWMMWNWLLIALATRATIVLIDGSPTWPSPERLFALAAEEDLTFLGVSAKYLDVVRSASDGPLRSMPHLRTVAATGSPLAPESYDFIRERVEPQVQTVSMSGGTDICGCFVLGDPTLPVHRGEIQGPALGMDVDVVDESGDPCHAGETGELVCRTAFPSVPLGFWGDDGSRFHDAYFARLPGVWTHGDFISRTDAGGFVIHGRSDSTLNAGGIRMGTAEFYQVLDDLPWIEDSVVVGLKEGLDEVIALFVVVRGSGQLTAARIEEVRSALRTRRSPRHVPGVIVAVPEVPRTRSGKLAELAVADAVNGRPVRDLSGLANPAALDWFTGWAQGR